MLEKTIFFWGLCGFINVLISIPDILKANENNEKMTYMYQALFINCILGPISATITLSSIVKKIRR